MALPWADGSSSTEDPPAGLTTRTAESAEHGRGRHAQSVRLRPEVLLYEQLRLPAQPEKDKILIGVSEDALAMVCLDFAEESHYTTKEAVVLLANYRRTMLGFVTTDHLPAYAVSADHLAGGEGRAPLDGRPVPIRTSPRSRRGAAPGGGP